MIGFFSFAACGQNKAEAYETVSPQEFAQKIKETANAYVLDVRTPSEYAEGHIQNAHNLDWLNKATFKSGAEKLPKGDTIFVYCRSGRRSAEAADYLSKLGYKVVDLDGGFMEWTGSTN